VLSACWSYVGGVVRLDAPRLLENEPRELLKMAKKSRGMGSLGSVPVQDLQAELRRRMAKVGTIARRRDRLMVKVNRLNDLIQELGGSADVLVGRRGPGRPPGPAKGAGRRGSGRTRPKNDSNLRDALAKVLRGKTMGVTEVAAAVQRHGYKTGAENFRTIVNQALLKHKGVFKKVARGQYTAA